MLHLWQVSAGLLKLWGAVGAVCTETPSETTISPNLRLIILNTYCSLFSFCDCIVLFPSLHVFPLCPRSPMWTMRATSWALASWSSHRPSSFSTHARETPSGGRISACDATATTPTCFLLRVVAAVRLGRVSKCASVSLVQLHCCRVMMVMCVCLSCVIHVYIYMFHCNHGVAHWGFFTRDILTHQIRKSTGIKGN